MIRVDKGLPLPGRGGAANGKYPWRSMQVGDSFLVKSQDEAECASCAARRFATYHGITFRTTRRSVAGGYRIWRTA